MKRQLRLQDLQISSFVTEMQKGIVGGMDWEGGNGSGSGSAPRSLRMGYSGC